MSPPRSEDPVAQARRRALNSLGRSDRSRASLRRRLADWGYEPEVVEVVLDGLQADRWLDDERYANLKAEAGVRKGWGPRRLKQELHLQGVEREQAAASLARLEVDWVSQATELAARQFERGKTPEQVTRWLAARGFEGEAIRAAVRRPYQ